MAARRAASLLDFGAAPPSPIAGCDEEEGLEEGILPAEGAGGGVAMDAEPEMGDEGASAGEVGVGLGVEGVEEPASLPAPFAPEEPPERTHRWTRHEGRSKRLRDLAVWSKGRGHQGETWKEGSARVDRRWKRWMGRLFPNPTDFQRLWDSGAVSLELLADLGATLEEEPLPRREGARLG